jgi:hypothetical protein
MNRPKFQIIKAMTCQYCLNVYQCLSMLQTMVKSIKRMPASISITQTHQKTQRPVRSVDATLKIQFKGQNSNQDQKNFEPGQKNASDGN